MFQLIILKDNLNAPRKSNMEIFREKPKKKRWEEEQHRKLAKMRNKNKKEGRQSVR